MKTNPNAFATKAFPVAAVFSILTDHVITSDVFDLGSFMMGEQFCGLAGELERIREVCRPHLAEQFPRLAGWELRLYVGQLEMALEKNSGAPLEVKTAWLRGQIKRCGETVMVRSIPVKAPLLAPPQHQPASRPYFLF